MSKRACLISAVAGGSFWGLVLLADLPITWSAELKQLGIWAIVGLTAVYLLAPLVDVWAFIWPDRQTMQVSRLILRRFIAYAVEPATPERNWAQLVVWSRMWDASTMPLPKDERRAAAITALVARHLPVVDELATGPAIRLGRPKLPEWYQLTVFAIAVAYGIALVLLISEWFRYNHWERDWGLAQWLIVLLPVTHPGWWLALTVARRQSAAPSRRECYGWAFGAGVLGMLLAMLTAAAMSI